MRVTRNNETGKSDDKRIPLGAIGTVIQIDDVHVYVDWDEEFEDTYEHRVNDIYYDRVWCVSNLCLTPIYNSNVKEQKVLEKIKRLNNKHISRSIRLRKQTNVLGSIGIVELRIKGELKFAA